MTWLTPVLASIAAAVAIPSLIILYFLKLRRRDMEVSTTLLWKKAIQDLQANAPFQKLRRNILLILQLIILAATLIAIAQPQIKGQSAQGSRHIILIDRSASMSSTDGDPTRISGDLVTRLDSAKKKARDLVESLSEPGLFMKESGDQAMVIAFDATAEVRQQFTADKNALKAAINAVTPTDAPTRIDEAMRLAKAHAPRRSMTDSTTGTTLEIEGLDLGSQASIHLYSDGAIPDAASSKPGMDDTFLFERIGQTDAGNVGITGLRSERAFDAPAKLSVFVGLQSTMRVARKVDVELTIDGAVAGVKSVQMPAAALENAVDGGASASTAVRATAGGAAASENSSKPTADSGPAPKLNVGVGGVVFTLDRTEGGLVRVRLIGLEPDATADAASRDALDSDNRAWLVVPPAKKLSVAWVTTGNLFLGNALESLPLSKLQRYSTAEFDKLVLDGKTADFDVVVLDGWLPGGEKARGLPPGRYIVLNAVPAGAGLIDKGRGPVSLILDWNRQHPVMRLVNLDSLTIAASRQVDVVPRSASEKLEDIAKAEAMGAGAATVLATCDQGVAIVETGGKDWRAIVVPFDTAESTWPFDVSFLVFLASGVDYMGGNGSVERQAQTVQPGSVLSDRLPVGASDAEVKVADGKTEPLIVGGDGKVVFGPIRNHGVIEVSWKGPSGLTDVTRAGRNVRTFASNLLDADESNVASVDRLDLASRTVTANAEAGAKSARKLWPYLLLAALSVVMLEWFVYNRKVYV